jgi:hypothetical protein
MQAYAHADSDIRRDGLVIELSKRVEELTGEPREKHINA